MILCSTTQRANRAAAIRRLSCVTRHMWVCGQTLAQSKIVPTRAGSAVDGWLQILCFHTIQARAALDVPAYRTQVKVVRFVPGHGPLTNLGSCNVRRDY